MPKQLMRDAAPARVIPCPKCKKPLTLAQISQGCFRGRCMLCDLEIRGSTGVPGADASQGYIVLVTYPIDYSPDGIGHVNDTRRGRRRRSAEE
jgi:hypothetical protein